MKKIWSFSLIVLLFSSSTFAAANLCESLFSSSAPQIHRDFHKSISQLFTKKLPQGKQSAYAEAKVSFIESYIQHSANSEIRADITLAILESAQGKPEMDPVGLRNAIYNHLEKTRNHQEWSLSKESENQIYSEIKIKINAIKKSHDTYHQTLTESISLLGHITRAENFTAADVNLMRSQLEVMSKNVASVALGAKVKSEISRSSGSLKAEEQNLKNFVAALDEAYSSLGRRDREDFMHVYDLASNFYMKAFTEIRSSDFN